MYGMSDSIKLKEKNPILFNRIRIGLLIWWEMMD